MRSPIPNSVRTRPDADHDTLAGRHGVTESEALHVRNYDHDRSYDVDVVVRTTAGEHVFRRRYRLAPGEVVAERDVIEPGDYEIEVRVDDDPSKVLEWRIGAAPERTAVVEIGNGLWSLTGGFRSERRFAAVEAADRQR